MTCRLSQIYTKCPICGGIMNKRSGGKKTKTCRNCFIMYSRKEIDEILNKRNVK